MTFGFLPNAYHAGGAPNRPASAPS